MLGKPWNGQPANFSGALPDTAVSYMKTIPSDNSSPSLSYVHGIVAMERGKAFHDHGGGPFHYYGTCWQAVRIVIHFGRLVVWLCFPFVNVHRQHQRSPLN